MPPRKRGKVDGGASPEAAGGGIGELPDDALHHVLSFLPAEEAVRTSVPARRWRQLWKSATGLRIGCGDDGDEPPSVDKLRQFVNHLLLLRKRDSSLDTCELRFSGCKDHSLREIQWDKDHQLCVNLWIRHVLDCQIRMLRLETDDPYPFAFQLDNLPLVSHHLTRLALVGVWLTNSFCNFSNFPNLEQLEIGNSAFHCVRKILSRSLKRLSITNYCFFDHGFPTVIGAPNLVSLRLDVHFRTVPVRGSMPSLKEAFVRNAMEDCDDQDCFSCHSCVMDSDEDDYNNGDDNDININNMRLLLEGLSKADNLTLMSDYDGNIFHKDFEWCPTFYNLRALLLNEWWFEDPDFHTLSCILKHSPVLENLTILLFSKGPKHNVEMIGRYHQMERPDTISKHLKAIEVKCKAVDERVHEVLKFLGALGIPILISSSRRRENI
ncbi:hypothetical protein ACP70R_003855 [Stipagrostis hirtigluma subsp. patula]